MTVRICTSLHSAGLALSVAATDSVVLDELVASPLGVADIVAFGLAAVAIAAHGAPALDRTTLDRTDASDAGSDTGDGVPGHD